MEEYYFNQDEVDAIFEYLKHNTIKCSVCHKKKWITKEESPERIQIGCEKCGQAMSRAIVDVAVSCIEEEVMAEEQLESFKTDKGKIRAGVLQDFSNALMEVAKVGDMGIGFKGYARGSWLDLENAEERYLDAFWRHLLDTRDINTEDDNVIVLAQVAWNALARLELKLRREAKEGGLHVA